VQLSNCENRIGNTDQSRQTVNQGELPLQSESDVQQGLHNEIADVKLNRSDEQITPAESDEWLFSNTTALRRLLPADNAMHSDEPDQVKIDIDDAIAQGQQMQEDTLLRSYKAISLSPQGNCYNAKVI
jgi:hypothetical protein